MQGVGQSLNLLLREEIQKVSNPFDKVSLTLTAYSQSQDFTHHQVHLCLRASQGAYAGLVKSVLAKYPAKTLLTLVYSDLTLNASTAFLQVPELGPDRHGAHLAIGAKMEKENTVS